MVHSDGASVRFQVTVVPRASRTRILCVLDSRLKITLAAPPVDDAANDELCALLAKALSVPRRAVRIAHGEHSKVKTVQVSGASVDQVLALFRDLPT
jgi:uncharacterized protein (TIGR00251 family)